MESGTDKTYNFLRTMYELKKHGWSKCGPDWTIVFDKDKVLHIYFVAEMKGSDSDMDIREIEKLKIHCAEKHFESISGGIVKFSKVSSYSKLLEMIN